MQVQTEVPTRTRRLRPLTHRRGRVLGVSALVLGLAACPSPVDWSEYEGVNLIGDRPLGASDSGGNSLWYFADGLDQDMDPGAPFDYVEFEEVGSGVYGSLPSGASGPVYRLEVVNLFADGTFEQETAAVGAPVNDPLGIWQEDDAEPAGTDVSNAVVQTGIIDGQSLQLDHESNTVFYAADLATALADGSFSAGEQYAMHLDFRMGIQTFGIELNNANPAAPSWSVLPGGLISRGDPISDTVVYAFPGSLGEDADRQAAAPTATNIVSPDGVGNVFLSLGGFDATVQGTSIVADIDNIRFVRNEQNHHLRLPVTYAATGRPNLQSGGSYTVRLWVRNDPTAFTTTTTETANRNPARFLSAGIDPRYDDPFTVQKARAVSGTDRQYTGGLSGWQQLEFQVSGGEIQLPPNVGADTVVFDLTLEVGDSIGGSRFRDSGSILISDVELIWSPAPLSD